VNSGIKLRGTLVVFGLIAVGGVGGGLYGIAKGELKWNPQTMLTGTNARLLGAAMLAGGLVLAALGLFVPHPLWEDF